VLAIEEVVKELPVPKLVPPVAALYQFIVPALAVADKVTVPVPQRAAGAVAVMVGITLTVIDVTAEVVEQLDKLFVTITANEPATVAV
jgi:hypothetical protein